MLISIARTHLNPKIKLSLDMEAMCPMLNLKAFMAKATLLSLNNATQMIS